MDRILFGPLREHVRLLAQISDKEERWWSEYRIMVVCLQQVHQQTKRSSTTSGHRRFPLYPEKGSRYPNYLLHTSTWRCQKYRIKKYHAHVILDHGDQSLASGAKSHFHDPDNLEAEKAEFRAELKRKAKVPRGSCPKVTQTKSGFTWGPQAIMLCSFGK